MNRKQLMKILPSQCLLFNRYSLQSVTFRENFLLEKLGIAQFVKIFPLENNPLYGIVPYVYIARRVGQGFNALPRPQD